MARSRTTASARGAVWLGLILLGLYTWPSEDRALPDCIAAAAAAEPATGRTIDVVCAAGRARPLPLRGPARLLFGERLDLNRAPASWLEVLPGIGPVRAAAIVAERESRRFERIEALERVRGIGPRTRERVTGWLDVGAASGDARVEAALRDPTLEDSHGGH